MEKAYQFGNINALLFATEGYRLGRTVSRAAGGAGMRHSVIALGNRASAGLPPEFVLISAALLPQTFLNVPFTTACLTSAPGSRFCCG